jgi:hypothetical protein
VSPKDLNPSRLASSPKKDRESTHGVSGVLRNLGEVVVDPGKGDRNEGDWLFVGGDAKNLSFLKPAVGVEGDTTGDRPGEGADEKGDTLGKGRKFDPSFEELVNRISGNSMPEKSTGMEASFVGVLSLLSLSLSAASTLLFVVASDEEILISSTSLLFMLSAVALLLLWLLVVAPLLSDDLTSTDGGLGKVSAGVVVALGMGRGIIGILADGAAVAVVVGITSEGGTEIGWNIVTGAGAIRG